RASSGGRAPRHLDGEHGRDRRAGQYHAAQWRSGSRHPRGGGGAVPARGGHPGTGAVLRGARCHPPPPLAAATAHPGPRQGPRAEAGAPVGLGAIGSALMPTKLRRVAGLGVWSRARDAARGRSTSSNPTPEPEGSSAMSFHIGQRVVCVNVDFSREPTWRRAVRTFPTLNGVYTIRSICEAGDLIGFLFPQILPPPLAFHPTLLP